MPVTWDRTDAKAVFGSCLDCLRERRLRLRVPSRAMLLSHCGFRHTGVSAPLCPSMQCGQSVGRLSRDTCDVRDVLDALDICEALEALETAEGAGEAPAAVRKAAEVGSGETMRVGREVVMERVRCFRGRLEEGRLEEGRATGEGDACVVLADTVVGVSLEEAIESVGVI